MHELHCKSTSDFLQDLNRRDPPIRGEFDGEGRSRRFRSKPITRRAATPAGEAAKSPLKPIAAHKRANYGPPAFRRPSALRRIGASPSGKAADFDSAIRRFESSRPSQIMKDLIDRGPGGPTRLDRPRRFTRISCLKTQGSACDVGFRGLSRPAQWECAKVG
jgi:hypothetical protein